ncbi:MAG: transketolase [Candidatus Niyogibacteria bacterium CG10_big_fil_rev_8_21_14_0_10_42_19]|uniref:Transketolase n=1 Tax=Candidatus Niyogibacteria bacterium CG10_big_fil_rev_8_21_14_0_10_42_19 TaxID=1974725 RepID=A0A2H0TF03_9BACT|nr:MAG: transketolase [Candidatus Niyogibacteria bacterium CG10_big_fil_rev_8_21_14_0_10_42_19]
MPANPKAKLVENILDLKNIAQAPTRNGFGEGLVMAADEDQNIVGLCADLTDSTKMGDFARKYPGRFVEMGIAEQNMAGVASGLAAIGKVPFITSYAMFSPGRNWEQVRTTICYNDRNVKLIGSHAGVSVGPDGATHQAIEDIALMRVIPNMRVFAPADMIEGKKVTYAISKISGPCYVRFTREKTPIFTTEETPFEIGKAQVFWHEAEGKKSDVVIFACGPLTHNAILASSVLENEGIGVRVINMVSIKPMDTGAVIAQAKEAGAVVTVEEHQISGGLGSAIAEVLSANHPVPIEFVGVNDRFGESGEPNELIGHFGMAPEHIVEAARKVINRKQEI